MRARDGGKATELIDREGELAQARRTLAEAARGTGRVLFVRAPAGGGKSALLEAIAGKAERGGFRLLGAAADQLELDLPFAVARQLLTSVADENGVALRGPAGLARPALGLTAAAPPGDAFGAALHGLHWLCVNLARERPLALCVDDAHWGDHASLRFLAYLARRIAEVPVVVMVASRPLHDDSRDAALAALHAGATLLEPAPLSAAAAQVLVRRLAPAADDQSVVACVEAAGGNPLLLVEFGRALHAGARARPEAPASLEPQMIARAVSRRLARLGDHARRLAFAAALFVDGAPLRLAAAAADLGAATAAMAADALADAGLLLPGLPLRYRHPVLRAAVLEQRSPSARALGHARVADLLVADGAPAEVIAAHLLAAEPSGRADRAEVLLEAGARASAAGTSDVAIRLLRRALDEPPAPERRGQVLHRLGVAELATGDAAAAETLAEAVGAHGGEVPPELSIALARALGMTGRAEGAVAVLERAAERQASEPDVALNLRNEAFWIAWQTEEHGELARRLIAESPANLEGRTVAEQIALCFSAIAALDGAQSADAIAALAARALADPQLLQAGLEAGPATFFATTALLSTDRLVEARDVLLRSEREHRRRGELVGMPMGYAQLAACSLLHGDLERAEHEARTALAELAQLPDEHIGWPWAESLLARALLEQGDVDGALAAVRDPAARLRTSYAMAALTARGEARAAAGDHEGAREDLEEAVAWCRARGLSDPAGESVARRRSLALARFRCGDRDGAEGLIADCVAVARAFGAPRLLAETLLAEAAIRRDDGSLTGLAEAVDVLRESPARLSRAKALIAYGAALRRANRRAAAREPLAEGLELAWRCGARRLEAGAASELRATGARIRRRAVTGVEALTPAEHRVAELAAAGLSNREIADELFVVPGTVEMHLGNTFRKLGIARRTQLAPLLATTGDEP